MTFIQSYRNHYYKYQATAKTKLVGGGVRCTVCAVKQR